MAETNRGRWTAQIEGDLVVLLSGARLQASHLAPRASATTARKRLHRTAR
jgi:hypothetical protein